MKRFLALLAPSLLFLPMVAYAQNADFGYFTTLIGQIENVITGLVPLLIGIALVAILLGLARYAFAAGDPEAQKQGKQIMLWGVIFLFVMVSIWGLVALLQTLTGIDGTEAPSTPSVPEVPGA